MSADEVAGGLPDVAPNELNARPNVGASEPNSVQPNSSQQQSVGNVQVNGEGNAFNIVQGQVVSIDQSQKKIIQVSVDEIKTREFVASSPYKGLKRFEPEDKDRFFGRSQFLSGLEAELEETNFVLLLGASGSGKSSVVRAGLVPRLSEKWGIRWVNVTFTPDRDPFESLYGSLLSRFRQSEAQLVRDGQEETLTQLVETLKEPDSFWFIFIDQFEELFTTTEADKRDRFIKSLARLCERYAGDSTVKIMATMRSDFLDRFDAEPANQLAQITARHRPLITQMQADELREVIEQPAAHHGVVFEEGLVETIIKEVQGQAGYLPLLQYTLARLWQSEVEDGGINDRTLNTQSYRNLGGVRGALQQRIEGIYQALSDAEKLATQRIFLRLVGIGGDSATAAEWKPVRKREARSRFSDETEQTVLAQLIDANLLVSSAPVEGSESASIVEIAHEILLTSWGQLREWIEGNREAIAFRNRLNEDVERWKIEKPDDELWSGTKLSKAVDLQNDSAFAQVLGGFSEEAAEFIESSIGLRGREAQAKEAQRQKELAQERKARKTAQKVTIGASVGGLLMAGVATFAAFQMRQAEIQQIETAVALSKAELANKQTLNADIASIRAAKTLKTSLWQKLMPNPQLNLSTLGQLQQASIDGRERNRLVWFQQKAYDIAFNPNGKQIAILRRDGTIHLWNIHDETRLIELEGHQGHVRDAVFSPDGTQIVTVGNDGIVRLWDTEGTQITQFVSHEDGVSNVVFGPSGTEIIATIGTIENVVRLWGTDGKQLAELKGSRRQVRDVVFSPEGKQLATRSDSQAFLWDTSGNQLAEFKGHQGQVKDVSFGPDGPQIVTTRINDTARLWDDKGTQLAEIGQAKNPHSVAFSPDGTQIVTTETNGTVQLWDTKGAQLAKFTGHGGAVKNVAFNPNGTQIATAGNDNTVRLWDAKGMQLTDFSGHQGSVDTMAFNFDGTQIATVGNDGTVRLWDTKGKHLAEVKRVFDVASNPKGIQIAARGEDNQILLWNTSNMQLAKLEGLREHVKRVVFNPQGTQLAMLGNSGVIRLWDTSGQQLAEFSGHTSGGFDVVFNPDGTQLATAGYDDTVSLWDIKGQKLAELNGHQGTVREVAFTRNGLRVATTRSNSSVFIWNIEGQQLAELKGHQKIVREVTFNPDGTLIATTGYDGTARLWNLDGQQLAELKGHRGNAHDIMFSPDGQLLATTGEDLTARLWNTDGQQLAEFQDFEGRVSNVVFSPNSTQIATHGDYRDTVLLWDIDGTQLAELKSYQGTVREVAFSLDSTQLVISDSEGKARLWLVSSTDKLLSKQCDWVRDYLTNTNNPDISDSDRRLCDGVPEFSKS